MNKFHSSGVYMLLFAYCFNYAHNFLTLSVLFRFKTLLYKALQNIKNNIFMTDSDLTGKYSNTKIIFNLKFYYH